MLGIVATDNDPAVAAAYARALSAIGSQRVAVTLDGMHAAFDAGLALIGTETYAAVGAYAQSPFIGADIRDRLAAAKAIPSAAVAGAERVRASFTAEVDAALARVDVLVMPTMPVPTLTLEQGRDPRAAIRVSAFVRPFNLSGHPALTIPLPAAAGFSTGLQIVGRRGGDADMLAIARTIEHAIAATVLA